MSGGHVGPGANMAALREGAILALYIESVLVKSNSSKWLKKLKNTVNVIVLVRTTYSV